MAEQTLEANGRSYTTGAGDNGVTEYGMADGGFRTWLFQMLGDVMVEVDAVKGAGSTSDTAFNLATSLPATQAFTIAVATAWRQGALVFGWSKADSSKWFYGTVAASSTGTSLSISIAYANGSGSPTDWIIASVASRRGTYRSVSGSDTQLTSDRDGTILYTGTGGHTQTLLAAATAGTGFETTFINAGTGAWAVGSFNLTPGQAITPQSNGSAWKAKSAVGYGGAAAGLSYALGRYTGR